MAESGALPERHQLHGVQPVLPVPDVAEAAAWFGRVLGLELEFIVGTPPQHARVKAGDGSWGAPVYIHLSRHTGPVPPSELRLHVGRDLDGLHVHVQAQGATVRQPPTVQPWGLREMVLQGPASHILVLAAEAESRPAEDPPRTVVACYRPKPGHEAELLDLVRRHVPELRRLGLATDHAPLAMRAADGTLVEVFEWASAQAIAAAHAHPEVHRMWAAFGQACTVVKFAELAEAQNLFPEFTPLDSL